MLTTDLSIVDLLSAYSYYYPLFMAYLWMSGAMFYYWRFERSSQGLAAPPLTEHPLVAIIVPCHNEGPHINETVEYLLACTPRTATGWWCGSATRG